MATVSTYLVVSGPSDPGAVPAHPLFQKYSFERVETTEGGENRLGALTFVLRRSLDESPDLEEPVRRFSGDVPDATVVMCTVEERFDQVERMQMRVYRDGKQGGEVEHGYIFNVGPG